MNNTQIKETARQILGQISDIQGVLSMSGSNELNIKLADIREKAALMFEGGDGVEKIITGYRCEAHDSLIMLGEHMEQHHDGRVFMNDAELMRLVRLAEIFVKRSRVYVERKARYIVEANHG